LSVPHNWSYNGMACSTVSVDEPEDIRAIERILRYRAVVDLIHKGLPCTVERKMLERKLRG